MTARDDYRAAEEKLAACEARIEATRAYDEWCSSTTDGDKPPPPGEPGDLASLLIERERLQEESYKAYRRVVAEREG